MSKYTTEVRYICEVNAGLKESAGYLSVAQIIETARTKIFNFPFPIFDENYRSVLETKILRHYYTREIGLETVGLWKLKLETKLNEIMPYYNKLYSSELLQFNPLYTQDSTRDHTRVVDDVGKNIGKVDTVGSGNDSTTNNGKVTDRVSRTPQSGLTDVENNRYLSEASITDNVTTATTVSGLTNTTNKVEDNNNTTTEDYFEHVKGYEGSNPNELLKAYRDNFLNIDMMVIEDLEELFFQLW